jgi:hypothetical protein
VQIPGVLLWESQVGKFSSNFQLNPFRSFFSPGPYWEAVLWVHKWYTDDKQEFSAVEGSWVCSENESRGWTQAAEVRKILFVEKRRERLNGGMQRDPKLVVSLEIGFLYPFFIARGQRCLSGANRHFLERRSVLGQLSPFGTSRSPSFTNRHQDDRELCAGHLGSCLSGLQSASASRASGLEVLELITLWCQKQTHKRQKILTRQFLLTKRVQACAHSS